MSCETCLSAIMFRDHRQFREESNFVQAMVSAEFGGAQAAGTDAGSTGHKPRAGRVSTVCLSASTGSPPPHSTVWFNIRYKALEITVNSD